MEQIEQSVHSADLEARLEKDLTARLPPALLWDIKIELFLSYNVEITYRNGRYLCTFCLVIGLSEDVYRQTLDYTIEYIKDHESQLA